MLDMAMFVAHVLVCFPVPIYSLDFSSVSRGLCERSVCMLDTSICWGRFLVSSVVVRLLVVVLARCCCLLNPRMLLFDVFGGVVE